MSLSENVIDGTLNADGTLQLDQKPSLPPGRVSVRVQSLLPLPEGDPFFDLLKNIWTARQQAALSPRSAAEIETQRELLRDASAEEIEDADRIQSPMFVPGVRQ